VDWELVKSGPVDAEHTVLLLPGGMTSARSYAELMAEPALSDVRLIAATLPGHCGTTPPADTSIENYGRLAGELATEVGADVLVGSSMGATVAVEMVTSKAFTGPTVLLAFSLSAKDEAAFFRAIVGLGSVLGALPSAILVRMSTMLLRSTSLPPARRAEYAADLRKNQPRVVRRLLRDYLRYLGRYPQPATRLCEAGVPIWAVHAEKGDGKLSASERHTLEACPHATLKVLPGTSYLLHSERPREIAEIIRAAVTAAEGRRLP
jgi:pimeloyl-ACP methyl ester carboxylesterase